jgi:hypothetical protein
VSFQTKNPKSPLAMPIWRFAQSGFAFVTDNTAERIGAPILTITETKGLGLLGG